MAVRTTGHVSFSVEKNWLLQPDDAQVSLQIFLNRKAIRGTCGKLEIRSVVEAPPHLLPQISSAIVARNTFVKDERQTICCQHFGQTGMSSLGCINILANGLTDQIKQYTRVGKIYDKSAIKLELSYLG